jgi:hypothetical protein
MRERREVRELSERHAAAETEACAYHATLFKLVIKRSQLRA